MFSGIFIDRPRLAFVIAIIITLAGIIAITAIPIAQFPDIVPPQVTLTASYPGADAEVVETTVAQPIELRQDAGIKIGVARLREIGFTGAVMSERKQSNHGAAGLLLALAGKPRPKLIVRPH